MATLLARRVLNALRDFNNFRTEKMLISAISGLSGTGLPLTDRPVTPAAEAASTMPPAQSLPTGPMQPLSPTVLAALLGQQISFYGSYNGN